MRRPKRPRRLPTIVFVVVSAALVGLSAPAASAFDGTPDPAFPSVDGDVFALVKIGSVLYVGGEFSSIGGTDVSNLAAVDAATGQVDPDWRPRTNGAVYALAADRQRIYVGGAFTTVDGDPHLHVAAVTPDGTVLPSWDTVVRGRVLALAVAKGRVFVGGSFKRVDGQRRDRLVALHARTGAVITTWDARTDAVVRALDVGQLGSVLYVGGGFANASGGGPFLERRNLAAFDTRSGRLDADWRPDIRLPVFGLRYSGAVIYAGLGGRDGGDVAAFDPRRQLPGTFLWVLHADGDVRTIARAGDHLYFGGHFDRVCERSGTSLLRCPGGADEVPHGKFAWAVLTATGAEVDPWNARTRGGIFPEVFDLAIVSGRLAVGGTFGEIAEAALEGLVVFDDA